MKHFFFASFLFALISSNAQFFIGIPFLDQCRKMSKCDLCNSKNSRTNEYLDSLDIVLKGVITENDSLSALNQIKIIEKEILNYGSIYASHLPELSAEKEIYGRLLLAKTKLLIQSIIEKDNKVYNLAFTDFEDYPNFEGVMEINRLIDEMIALNISESTNEYLRELRMKYMYESYAFDMVAEDIEWYYNKSINSLKGVDDDRRDAAKIFLDDEERTNYVPFSSFVAIGLGATGAIGKGNWFGYEFSDEYVEYTNPFLWSHAVSGSPHFRFSFFGTSYLINMNDRSKQDLLFDVLNFKHPLLNINLIQFGIHYGVADKGKWLYRPEIGLSYGIFKANYAYNLTFDKSVRSLTEKNLFTFGISYPLIRIGKYY
jgi:hypothetical protein